MKHATAENVMTIMQNIDSQLTGLIDFVRVNEDQETFERYGKAIAGIKVNALLSIMAPIFKMYPDLTPADLKPPAAGLRQEDKQTRS